MSAERYRARARSTGTTVIVEDTLDPGSESGYDGNRWATICLGGDEPHGGVASHPTLALARAHAPHPEEWCEECMASAGE